MPVANNRLLTDDTGLALVDAIERIAPLQIAPLVVSIPTGQWSGSGSDYYISVSASNVTANSILVPNYDNESAAYLKGPVWCVPTAGSFTIHTSVVPSGTVNIMVQFPGTMGEANYQVLSDVYSKSQAVAKADIVNNLTNNDPTKVASQAEAYALAQKSIDTSGAQYVKFADGMLIQWGAYVSDAVSTTAVGSLYMATIAPNITFPIQFNTAPQVSIMQYGGYGAVFTSAFNSTGISSVDLARPTSGSITPNLHWIAIGR